MPRTASLLVGLVVLFGIVSAFPTVGQAHPPSDALAQTGGAIDENASEVSPGERFAGVVGVQRAEVDGEMDRRTFGVQLARATSDDAKAAVVGDRLRTIERSIEALNRSQRAVQQARADGNISEGAYRARVATLAAQAMTLQRLTQESENATHGLSADALERNGVDPAAIHELRRNASALTGPEVAAIARSIAGPAVGAPIGSRAPPVDVGPPDDRGPTGSAPSVDSESATTTDAVNATTTPTDDGPPDGPTGPYGPR